MYRLGVEKASGGAVPDLSQTAGEVDATLLDQTVGDNLAETASRFPERPALIDLTAGIRLTYAAFDAEVTRIARALVARGLAVGDRVGVWSPNCAEWTLVQYATARAGIILVTINPAYRSHELVYALNQSGCRWVFAPEQYRTSAYREMLEESQSELPAVEQVVYFGTDDWSALLADGDRADDRALNVRMVGLSPDDPINIQYTSGTTGFPKGATLTHRNILNNGYFVGELCGYTEHDVVCIPVPLYHCFGMVMGNLGSTTHGSAMVIPAPTFDAEATLRAVESERCTSLYGVPTMFIAELSHADFDSYDLSTLRTGIMAGAPCPVEVMKQVVARMNMREVTICYGMTETSPVSTQTRADDSLERRVSTVGRVHPHVEVRVITPGTDTVVERGEPGELCTRGYSVMQGYWAQEERTREVIDAEGWMHTGDLAVMDADGYLNIVGRIKDLVIRGGENIYPREIEEFLLTHPEVLDAHVVGVPDERYGEELCAWVRRQPGSTLSEDEVRAFCRERLARFKVPRYVHFTAEFPMTVTGKVQKYLMREQSIAELGLQVAASIENA